MRPHLVCVLALAGLAACGKTDGGPKAGPMKRPPPSEKCGAAADNVARFEHPAASPEELAPAALAIKGECEQLGLSDDEAQCLADAQDPLATLKCPRAIGKELREIEREIGTGRCRPVMLVAYLAEIQQLRQIPPEQRAAAMHAFTVVKRVLGGSCRTDNWGTDAMECFATRDVMQALDCMQSVPPEILQKIDTEIKKQMLAEAERGGDDPTIEATGVAACDAYLRAKKSFGDCEAAPSSLKRTLLAIVEPLEKPWRSLPAGSLAALGATFSPMCEQAFGQLQELASQVGCQ
jgi:hypothetical protein